MNKDLLNQLTPDEQPVASQLTSVAEDMQLSHSFQSELETQLMDTAKKKTRPTPRWYSKIMVPVGWAVLAICAIFLLNWTVRSLASNPPVATEAVPDPAISFESDVRQGRICASPLALAHDSSVFLTNHDKSRFSALNVEGHVDELRTFAWSPDGSQLAIVANTSSRGQVYIKDFDRQLEYILPTPNPGYLMDIGWSWDGKRLLARSIQSRSTIYLMNADGTGSVEEKPLDAQFFETPQFTPGDQSLVFEGSDTFFADQNSMERAGLIQLRLDSLETGVVGMGLPVQAERSFAWSPDGSHLAYLEVLGNELLHLVVEDPDKGNRVIVADLPNPKGTFGSMPINMSWSPDGRNVVFEFGYEDSNRAIYLAHLDGSGLVKLVDSAYAPAISADGRCLAYISNDQVFLMDLAEVSLTSASGTPVFVADLPTGGQTTYPRLDKLQWRP
jgi:WD40 repeat protein